MARWTNKLRLRKPAGSSPGTLVHNSRRGEQQPRLEVMTYNGDHLEERELVLEDLDTVMDPQRITWINVIGLNETVLEAIGQAFNLHPLVLEDALNTGQRPKFEDYDEYLFVVLKMLSGGDQWEPSQGPPPPLNIDYEQLSIIMGRGYVLTLQEHEGDVLGPVRERIRKGKGRIRTSGSGYLAYALVDTIVDYYFEVLEQVGDRVEYVEEKLIQEPRPEVLREIHLLKSELLFIRKSVWPLREIVGGFQRVGSDLVAEDVHLFLRDVYDHTIQVMETLDTYRDLTTSMLDLYLSSTSNRMNEIMKVLTIIATLFIPLTFIVGVYGMNFVNMPELHLKWGYFAVWGVMIVIAAVQLYYFRIKHWI